jgi:hypothetical protein
MTGGATMNALDHLVTAAGASPSPSASSSPAPGPPDTATLTFSGHDALWITLGLLVLALAVVAVPVVLAMTFRPHVADDPAHPGRRRWVGSVFEVPYISWFLLHLTVSVVGIIAVLVLAIDGLLNSTASAALLSGLFGFVLGSASGRGQQPAAGNQQKPDAAPSLDVTAVVPATAAAGSTVTITGVGFAENATVTFGNKPATAVERKGPTLLTATVPAGSGTVDVTVRLPSGVTVAHPQAFTYQA